jgi:ribosomal protein S7
MKKINFVNLEIYNSLYYLFIKTLVGKLIKKGKKNKALKFYKILREYIKLNIKKKRKKEVSFIFLLSMLNSMPRVSFKEIRLGSQKKDVPMPINEKKQVLVCVDTLLKASKNKKKIELSKLTDYIITSSYNDGIIIRNKKLKYRKAIINKMLLNIFMPKKKKWKEKEKNVSEENNYKIFKDETTL